MSNNKSKAKGSKSIKASDMIFLAALAYLCKLVEPIVKSLITDTALVDKVPLGNVAWTVILRVVCCLCWGGLIYALIKASKKCGFDPLQKTERLAPYEWVLTAALTLAAVLLVVAFGGGWQSAIKGISSLGGAWRTVTYFPFAAFNTAIMVLTLSLAQKTADILLPKYNRYIPYGGIFYGICAVVEFMIIYPEFYLSPIMLLRIFAMQLVYGMIFVLAKKNAKISYPFIYLLYISSMII